MRLLYLVLLLTVASNPDAMAKTWYVATNGNDNQAGTLANPFKTLVKAIDAAAPGDVIELRAGQYASQEIRIGKSNLTIRSYPGEWAVIAAPLNNEDIASCIWYNEPEVEGGVLENLEITGGYYYALSFETNWDWGITPRHGVSNITVRHCRIHDSGRDCIKIKPACNNIQILGCELYNSGIGPSNTPDNGGPNAEGIDNVNGDGMIVRHCYIHHTSTSGVYAKGGAQNCIIEENLVMHTGEAGILLGFYTDAEFFDQDGSNPQFYECNYSMARNNIVIDTRGAGIGFFAARNCAAYNNTVVTASVDFHAPLYLSPGEIWIDDNTTLHPANLNIQVFNNIFVDLSGNGDEDYSAQLREGALSGDNLINFNIYHKTSGPALFDDGISWPALNFAGWKAALGADAQSQETDPKLDAQYHLLSGSPAINAGQNSPATRDYDTQPRTGQADIGADEYSNGPALSVPPPAGVIGTGGGNYTSSQPSISGFACEVFPIPAASLLRVRLDAGGSQLPELRLLSLQGQVLANGHGDRLDVSHVPAGLCTLEISLDGAVAFRPLVIAR